MTNQIEDPFAGADEDEDFASPDKNFLGVDDLDGRLVIIFPHAIAEVASTKPGGKPYDRVTADVVVVDGAPTDKLTSLPHLATDMYLSASALVGAVRKHVGKGKPVLGRVDSRPSSYNKQVKAYGLADPTDADKAAARPALAKYRAGQFA